MIIDSDMIVFVIMSTINGISYCVGSSATRLVSQASPPTYWPVRLPQNSADNFGPQNMTIGQNVVHPNTAMHSYHQTLFSLFG